MIEVLQILKQVSKSISENTPLSGLSAEKDDDFKQRQKGDNSAAIHSSLSASSPSPSEVIAAKVKRSQESYQGATPRQGSAVVTPDVSLARLRVLIPRMEPGPLLGRIKCFYRVEQDSDTDSELEEISLDEPSAHAQRKPRRQSDVTSLISALDTTLKLSNGSIDRESPDVETVPEEPEETEPLDVPAFGGSPTTSGRLRDRIDRLRRECIRGIGEDLLIKAYNIIDTHQEDFVEEALVRLMGRENFERYGGPIWQLKFCESFKAN
ncbi:Serine/threonine-protein kinase Nek4 [Desmophyllum pertusum]|uniref:Serine/threonine-protein kinase Nek4 n=1 Tax=Desmophyllum pertusum TaxID=174260 RepID=A0A9W9ZVT5_9CNID|nr:Serine/threonine-protein kinase Nek4 [Desmophyllum pertusum]